MARRGEECSGQRLGFRSQVAVASRATLWWMTCGALPGLSSKADTLRSKGTGTDLNPRMAGTRSALPVTGLSTAASNRHPYKTPGDTGNVRRLSLLVFLGTRRT